MQSSARYFIPQAQFSLGHARNQQMVGEHVTWSVPIVAGPTRTVHFPDDLGSKTLLPNDL